MHPALPSFLMPLAAATGGNAALLLCVILVASFLLEDAAIVGGGWLAAQGLVDPLAAILVLVLGTSAGDVGLHLAGRWAGNRPWVHRRRNRPRVRKAIGWIERHDWIMLAAARFLPGTRMPVYLASGLIRLPIWRCAVVITLASCVWTPSLLLLSMKGRPYLRGSDGIPPCSPRCLARHFCSAPLYTRYSPN